MATRNRQQREVDLTAISAWYLEGHNHGQIAALLANERPYSVTRRTISSDIAEMHKRWRATQVVNMGAALFLDLQRVDHLERVYWQRYESALKERQRTTTRQRNAEKGSVSEAGVVTEQGVGWNHALAGVERCQMERRRLLGLYAPEKVWQLLGGAQANDADTGSDLDSIRREIAAQLTRTAERERAGSVVIAPATSDDTRPPVALARLVS